MFKSGLLCVTFLYGFVFGVLSLTVGYVGYLIGFAACLWVLSL